jgi:class 3 adenylate cyclase
VLVLDMSGFSQLTSRHGIIYYLAMVAQMEEVATPSVVGNGGHVFKQEADNLFAVFPGPAEALEASLDVLRGFEAANTVLPDDRDIFGGIGIGYGELLVIGATGVKANLAAAEDVFGEEMNAACRLGEDLAARSEILLTPAAHAALPAGRYAFETASYQMKGDAVSCHRFVKKLFEDPEQTAARAKPKAKGAAPAPAQAGGAAAASGGTAGRR